MLRVEGEGGDGRDCFVGVGVAVERGVTPRVVGEEDGSSIGVHSVGGDGYRVEGWVPARTRNEGACAMTTPHHCRCPCLAVEGHVTNLLVIWGN